MSTVIATIILLAALITLVISVRYRKRFQSEQDTLMKEYGPVDALKTEVSSLEKKYANLQSTYKEKRSSLQTFESTISSYNIGVGTIDASTYKPLFDALDVSDLQQALQNVKEQAKALVRAKKACISELPENLVINGRKGAAKTFVNREVRLRIRCLDNEVKAAIAAAAWNNINRLVERVQNKFKEINEDSKLVKIFLEEAYLDLKLKELRLSYEIKQLNADLREEQRAERQRIREEERAEARVQKELEKAERDRARMEKLVQQELAKIGEATAAQKEKLALHQKELELLKAKESRAMSLAQQTRAGYVYIISNEASFGQGVCKIGMTRRLDPNDRVKELGDASVPELFTVHAFIYTEDAPTLEKYFHDQFQGYRVNLVNRRKEFFRLSAEEAVKALERYQGRYNLEAID